MEDLKKGTKCEKFIKWGFFCYPKKITSKNPFFFYSKIHMYNNNNPKNINMGFTPYWQNG